MVTADGFDRSLLLDRRTSNPTLPSGVDTFSPPVDSEVHPVAGSPMIAASNLDGQPDDTLTITGSKLTNYSPSTADAFSDTRLIIYGQTGETGTFADASIQDTGNVLASGVLATIPTSLPSDSMYLVWPVNAMGVGSPVAINRTDAQWMLPSPATTVYEDTTVSVYGRNLANASGDSWVYLQPDGSTSAGEWMNGGDPITGSNPYRVQFTPSDDLAAGVYDVWVYNGRGGVYGWSEAPGTINFGGTRPITEVDEVNVETYGAVGDGSTDDGAAIQLALHNTVPNEVLYFPPGTYVVDNTNYPIYLSVQGTDLSGSYEINLSGGVSSPLPYDATASQIQTAITDLTGFPDVSVDETSTGQYTITGADNRFIDVVQDTLTASPSSSLDFYIANPQLDIPSNVKIIGYQNSGGAITSIIQFKGPVPYTHENSFAYEIGTDVHSDADGDVTNIGLAAISLQFPLSSDDVAGTGLSDSPMANALLSTTNTDDITLENVTIDSGIIAATNFDGGSGINIENSAITSFETAFIGCTNVSLDSDWFYQAYGGDEFPDSTDRQYPAVSITGSQDVSMTNCRTENLFELLTSEGDSPSSGDTNLFDDGKFVEFVGENPDVYCASNESYDLGECSDPDDGNSGEQILVDGGISQLNGGNAITDEQVSSSTSDSVTIANVPSFAGVDLVGYYLDVTSGPDMGERFQITASTPNADDTATTLTIGGQFAVTPNVGDYINVNLAPTNMVFYQNTLNHTTSVNPESDAASTGFDIEGGYGIVIDGNTINNTLYGMRLYSDGIFRPDPTTSVPNTLVAPLAFADVMNNTVSVVQTGANDGSTAPEGIWIISEESQSEDISPRVDPDFYGVAVRANTVGLSESPIGGAGVDLRSWQPNSDSAVDTFTAIEHNTITGFTVGIAASNDPNSIAYKNDLTGPATDSNAGIAFNTSTGDANVGVSDLLLLGNTYSEFPNDYTAFGETSTAALPNSPLQIPQRVYYMTSTGGASVSQTIELENTGPTPLYLPPAYPTAPHVTLTPSSLTIGAEQSITGTLTVSPGTLGVGVHTLVLSIDSSADEPMTITVYLTVE